MTFPTFIPTIGELVARAAEQFGAKDVPVADGQRLTLTELGARSRSVARGLLAGGLAKHPTRLVEFGRSLRAGSRVSQ